MESENANASTKSKRVANEGELSSSDRNGIDIAMEHGKKAGWLAPIALDPPRKKVREKMTTGRASNKGCLSMILDEYLRLLDLTGRQIRKHNGGVIPKECAPILEHLDRSTET